jgi:hypothetical protein
MNDHVDTWLDAHLDGELGATRAQQVEAHLGGCQRCKALLEGRRSLSTLLQEVPTAGDLKPHEQFVAEVNLRVRSGRASHQAQKWPFLAWQFAPVALLLAWAFFYTVSILSNLLRIVPGAGQLVQQQVSPLASTLRLPWLAEIDLAGPQVDGLGLMLGSFNILDWNWLTNLLILSAIGLLYLGWLVSWWARARQTQNEVGLTASCKFTESGA